MAVTFGFKPKEAPVELSVDGDFVTGITRKTGTWDPDLSLEFRFGSGPGQVVWPATIDGARAGWNVDKTDVNALLATDKWRKVSLYYVLDGVELLWFKCEGVKNG